MIDSSVRLIDINNKTIPLHYKTDEPSFFIRSFQKFSVEIVNPLEGNKLYSVVADFAPIDPTKPYTITTHNSFLNGNSSYTLFFVEEQTLIITVIGETDNKPITYTITYVPENTISKAQLYTDLIANNNLPTLEELLPCLLDSSNKKDILQRMLLDFKSLVKTKGTKTTILNFLEFMSFGVEGQFNIFDEYLSYVSKTTTIIPDKEVDTKTGDYWAEYNNYTTPNNEFTSKNLPNRLLDETNLEEFWVKLERAIVLANTYFTLPEQTINRWHLNNSVNVPVYLSIASNSHINNATNPHLFYSNIHIYAWNLVNSEKIANYLIQNNLLVKSNFGNSEVRYYNSPTFEQPTNSELFLIETEISDDSIEDLIPQDDLIGAKSVFANITNLTVDKINGDNYWIEYRIEEIANPMTAIHKTKFPFTEKLDIKFLSKKLGAYRITIDIFNGVNSRERFMYILNKTTETSFIEFVSLCSLEFDTDNKNNLDLDIESTSPIKEESLNYTLDKDDVPEDLRNYFSVTPTKNVEYVRDIKLFNLPRQNKNFVISKMTDIPLGYMDSFVNLISFKYSTEFKHLKLNVTNPLTGDKELFDYYDESLYQILPDVLFITSVDVYENVNDVETVPYIFISTTKIGIDISRRMFDFYLVSDSGESVSIYDLGDANFLHKKNKPVNYDTILFHQESSLNGVFANYPEIAESETITPSIKLLSTFPRLKRLNGISNPIFKLDDILVCVLPNNYVIDAVDIKWCVYNSFTGVLIFETFDKSLKYRIADNTIFDVEVKFNIRGTDDYVLRKNNIISSFIFSN